MAGTGRKSGDDVLVVRRAAGDTIAEAASASGMSERTAYRRLDSAIVQARITEARRQMVGEATGKLSSSLAAVAVRLRQLVASQDERVAVAAAKVSIDSAVSLRKVDELDARMTVLERRLDAEGKGAT